MVSGDSWVNGHCKSPSTSKPMQRVGSRQNLVERGRDRERRYVEGRKE